MKSDYHNSLFSAILMLLIVCIVSCSGKAGKKEPLQNSTAVTEKSDAALQLIKIVSPDEDAGFKLHQSIKVSLAPEDKNTMPDSVIVYFNGNRITSLRAEPWECTISPSYTVATGRKSLKATSYKGGKPQNTVTRFTIIYSDLIPGRYSYKVIHTYPHNRDAFTQGLVYDNGVLFEGTGQETGSSLREVELETGKVLRQRDLNDSLFGEGITLYKNLIYQVTWKSKIGFIYDKSDFKELNKIYYATQGWGLTTIDDKIVMSDGSNILYFYEPDMFTVVSKIEVYDNEKKVDQLNELEYINGEIWANIWMTDTIARIDPLSGKVLAYVDMRNLLAKSDRTEDTDVLNGIAFDKTQNRIFVTGKLWPKLFEIKVVK